MSSRDDLGSLEPNLEDLEDLDRYEPLDDLDRATESRPRRRPVLSILGVILAIAAGAAGAWYFLGIGGEDESIPLVTADPEPVKVRPDKPGGLEVPHQEISVLNQPAREPAGEAERPEVLLPPPEAPMPVPPPPPIEAPGTGVPAVPTIPVEAAEPPAAIRDPEQTTEIVIPPIPPLPSGVVPSQAGGASSGESAAGATAARLAAPPLPEAPAIPPAPKIPAAPAAPPAPVAQTPTPPPPAPVPQAKLETTPVPPPSPPAADGYRAQVASAKGQADANRKVAQLRKAHADLFGPLPLRVRRVDLGAKGIWYRVQAGAFAEKGQATALCEELKRRGEKGCWVAR